MGQASCPLTVTDYLKVEDNTFLLVAISQVFIVCLLL